jgi:hypothetical protein
VRTDSDVGALAKQYARRTRQRMALAISELLVMQRAGMGDTCRLSRWMEEQEEASQAAGFAGMARLCGTVSECLAGLRRGEQPVLVPLFGTLLEVCRTVELHAEIVARTLTRATGHPTRSRGRNAGEAKPAAGSSRTARRSRVAGRLSP